MVTAMWWLAVLGMSANLDQSETSQVKYTYL